MRISLLFFFFFKKKTAYELRISDWSSDVCSSDLALGAPVYQQTVVTGAHFPSEHPLFLGQPSRDQKQVRALLEPYDTLICVGSDVLRMSIYSEVDPLPPHMKVIQIGQRDWEMGKNYAAAMAVRADVKETLKVLTPLLVEMGGDARRRRNAEMVASLADRNWSATKKKRTEAAKAKAGQSPMSADWLMMSLCGMLPEDVVVVDEGITTAAALNTYLPYRDRYSYLGNVSGGIGWGIAAAVGAQIAQPERRVVAIIGDGSAMYSIKALSIGRASCRERVCQYV